MGKLSKLREYLIADSSFIHTKWLMSKRISRECALGPDWRGSGLGGKHSPFDCVSEIDFSDVSVNHSGLDPVGTIFTVSSCGKFLMASNGCLIYIYEINRSHLDSNAGNRPGHLRPVTSIICPRRVLACSMDTSCERYAIAALLDGRMGVVCDFASRFPTSETHGNATTSPDLLSLTKTAVEHVQDAEDCLPRPSFLDRGSLNSSSSALAASGSAIVAPFVFPGIVTSPVLNPTIPTGSQVSSKDESNFSSTNAMTSGLGQQLPWRRDHENGGSGIQSTPLDLANFHANAMSSKYIGIYK